jgi:hypothetical protein
MSQKERRTHNTENCFKIYLLTGLSITRLCKRRLHILVQGTPGADNVEEQRRLPQNNLKPTGSESPELKKKWSRKKGVRI